MCGNLIPIDVTISSDISVEPYKHNNYAVIYTQ